MPDEDQAVKMTMNVGVDEAFARYVHRTWAMRAGKDASGVLVNWLPYVTGRWKNEQVE